MADAFSELTAKLLRLLATHSLRRGSFVLTSGATSSYYIDARLTTMHPEGLTTIGPLALHHLAELHWNPDAIGGMTLGADPVAYAIAYASAGGTKPLRAFTVRKEPKRHGTQQQTEGPLMASDSVVIIEDVITTGRSALHAAQVVQAMGVKVLGVLGVVDRAEGGRDNLEKAGLRVTCLTSVADILAITS